jgi:hypothetical protein
VPSPAHTAPFPSPRSLIAAVLGGIIALLGATAAPASAAFPERAYEIAGQYPTGSIPLDERNNNPVHGVDRSGDQFLYYSLNPLPGTVGPAYSDTRDYVVTRGAGGWTTAETVLPIRRAPAPGRGGPPADDAARVATTTDIDFDPDDQNGERDVYQRKPDGSWEWISRDPRIPPGTPQTTTGGGQLFDTQPRAMPAMSADGSVVFFNSGQQLLDEDTDGGNSMYKYRDGELSYVAQTGFDALGGGVNHSGVYALNAVSEDGSQVIWQDGNSLYLRKNDDPAVEVTTDPLGSSPPADPQALFYQGATTDGSRILLTSSSRLTDDAGGSNASSPSDSDLYLYDTATDTLRDLTPRLDGGSDPTVDPLTEDRARVLGAASFSQDPGGPTRVYFVAAGDLGGGPSPEGASPIDGAYNLYMAEIDGIGGPVDLHFIAALNEDDAYRAVGRQPPLGDALYETWRSRSSYASPDGSVFGFGSTDPLTAGEATGGFRQMFVYAAAAHSLDCASCPSDGSAPAGNANQEINLANDEQTSRWQLQRGDKHWVSEDGTVFFDTGTPLLPADTNDADDVYAYQDGELEMISSGSPAQSGSSGAHLIGASADGSSVFFSTREALVRRDEEPGIRKIYVARVGGGFGEDAPPPVECSGDECQGDPSGAPSDDQPATGGQGAGNPTPPPSCDGQASRVDRYDDRIAKLKDKKKRAKRKAKQASGKKAQRKRQRAKRIGKKIRKVRGKKRDAKRDLRACRRGQ